ncbi:hypothetical protein NQ318_016663 [Aromia moschata]|uniref:Uncharacterized protein n=1 Tax=Aromia moschata TaxID=1265417 RepID=A0AAV8Y204_9CUCU|nr:hypothetical protein NQ318_016663 [Aromia moschata]
MYMSILNFIFLVPLGPQPQGNKGPQVRTIPVQIEGDDPPQPYVHPSEQVVPEPKKYTGSSIPSRSFKILQAMTAPDNCANVDEQYEALPYEQWGYDPNYPSYPPPNYWHDYYYNYYYQEPQPGLSKEEHETSAKSNPRQTPTPRQTPAPRQTPVPFWGYAMSPYPYQTPRRQSTTDGESDAETSTNPRSTPSNGRSTPSPFWGYGYQQFPEPAEKACEEPQVYPYPPPYYDPYYYYYYGYPPMYPPYPYYGVNSDTDEMAGYSSTDEMAYYNRRAAEKGRNNRRSSSTPRTIVTPTINVKETVINNKADTQNPEIVEYTSDSASETETEEEVIKPQGNNPLRSIRSVSNIQVYAEEETNSHCSDDEVYIEECSEEANEDVDEEGSVYIVDDDAYPHQLSVIYEESERTDSRMRCASALSDSTTIAEKSDYEEDSPEVQNPSKPFKFCVSVGEENEDEVKTIVTVGDGEITTFEEKSSSATPRNETDTSDEEDDVQDEAETTEDEENDDTTPNEEIEEEEGKESDESEDWWGIIGKEDDLPKPRVVTLKRERYFGRKKEEAVEQNSICSETTEPVIHDQTENQKTKIENNSVVVDQKPKNNYARAIKSVYDKIEDQFEEEENTGKLIELESFVARLEQMQKESGLWNIQIARNKSKSKLVKANSSKDINRKDTCDQTSQPEKGNKNMNYNDKVTDSCTAIKSDDINFKLITNDNNDSSASYSNYNSSKSAKLNGNYNESVKNEEITQQTADNDEENDETSDDTDSSSEDESEISQKEPTEDETAMQIQSIKQRIQALKESIRLKQSKLQGQEIKSTVKEKVNTLETTSQSRSKTTSTKSSVKSFEEYSEEEEGDSGVTSDMSRHISDTEEFPELKKLTRYQRAATHSRLFKLLQDECENAEDEDEVKVTLSEAEKQATKEKSVPKEEPPRRDQLSLPLRKTNESDSLCSSGVNSPGSPVNEKLVNELVQSLLKHKKGQMFRNMPKVKLYAAAAKILQEDLDLIAETPSDCSSFMSPLRDSTGYSTAAQTPQEFNGNYDEYRQYYETWNEAENYDILPSKAFKLLQEHSNLNKTGAVAGLLAKCPRVLSSKNIHKRLMKLLESSECPSPTPENPLESNEVTSAS